MSNRLMICLLWLSYAAAGCKTDYHNLPAFSEQKQLQVVNLTPAGSNHPQAYDAQQKAFVNAEEAGLAEQVLFLPYPGNYGFIPSTRYKGSNTNEGKPLEALVLAEALPTGTVQEVIPISTILLDIAGEVDYLVVAVPSRPSEQIIAATNFATFQQKYPAAKEIIQKWLTHYKPSRQIRVMSWKDERYTEQLIRRWLQ